MVNNGSTGTLGNTCAGGIALCVNSGSTFTVDTSGNAVMPGFKLGSGPAMTGVQGTGTSLATWTGATGAGNLVSTNGSGTLQDSGVSPGTLVVTTANNSFVGNNFFVGDTTYGTVTAATSGANNNSPNVAFHATYWNGSSSAIDVWNWQDMMGSGTNPTSTLKLTHTGSAGRSIVSIGNEVDALDFVATLGNVTGKTLAVLGNVSNNPGFQIATVPGCAITIGAIGNSCIVTITLANTEPDTAYIVAGCSFTEGVGTTGPFTIGSIFSKSTTLFQTSLVALTAVGANPAGIGTISCTVVHN